MWIGERRAGTIARVESLCDDEADADAVEVAENLHRPGVWFSLAGVAMKFSMLLRHEKLTIPAHGEGETVQYTDVHCVGRAPVTTD